MNTWTRASADVPGKYSAALLCGQKVWTPPVKLSNSHLTKLCVPPQCWDASSFARSGISNFSFCNGHFKILLSRESQILEILPYHMTRPTVANAGLARKPDLCSVCTEALHPALLLVAGSSPWHAGSLLSWGPARTTREGELNDYSRGCKPCFVVTFHSAVAL